MVHDILTCKYLYLGGTAAKKYNLTLAFIIERQLQLKKEFDIKILLFNNMLTHNSAIFKNIYTFFFFCKFRRN